MAQIENIVSHLLRLQFFTLKIKVSSSIQVNITQTVAPVL